MPFASLRGHFGGKNVRNRRLTIIEVNILIPCLLETSCCHCIYSAPKQVFGDVASGKLPAVPALNIEENAI